MNINEAHELILNELAFNLEYLQQCQVQALTDTDLEQVSKYVFASFCFDNALTVSNILEVKSIVYGAAIVHLSGGPVVAEHCWVKLSNDTYSDPTYQLENSKQPKTIHIDYFTLFEIPVTTYEGVAKDLGNPHPSIMGMDFTWFRSSAKYKHLFTQP